MAKTTEMKLLELMVLKQDISSVIEYIGKRQNFLFQNTRSKDSKEETAASISNIDKQFFEELKKIREDLVLEPLTNDIAEVSAPVDEDRSAASKIIASYKELQERLSQSAENLNKLTEAYNESMAFSNLQVSYSELEHLSFLSLKLGKISEKDFDDLKNSLEGFAVVIPLGNDKSRILVASSKKGRFALETELKKVNFVEMQVPPDFKGIPQDVLDGMKLKRDEAELQLHPF